MHPIFLASLLIFAGCASSGGSSAPSSIHETHHIMPDPLPFADIAGTYQATETGDTGNYAALVAGHTWTVVIDGNGIATATDDISGTSAVYTLSRTNDGSFASAGRSITGGLTEFASAPANLSTLTLTALKLYAGSETQGILYGYAYFDLIKLSAG